MTSPVGIALLWVHFICSNGTLGRKSFFNDFTASIRDGAGTCVSGDSAGPPAPNRDFGWGVRSFARGAGSAKPARASYGADGTLPPPPTRQVPKRAHDGPKDACRAKASRAGKGFGGGDGGFQIGAGWAKPQKNAAGAARADVSALQL
jgi:hypothetical protein